MTLPGWLDHPRPVPIAHRGGGLENEENTLPAFAHAVGLGYRHLETDVRLTLDGEVVVHHDATLARLTGDPRRIDRLTWAELKRLRTHGGAAIPRLTEVLEEFPDTLFNIEPKAPDVVEPLAQVIRRAGAIERFGTGCFDPRRTARLRGLLGDGISWSPAHRGVLGLWLRGWGLPIWHGRFPVVQVPLAFRGIRVVTPRFLRAAHARGVQVQVWTVDDEAEMRQLLDMGVDGIMTDRPTLLKAVLQSRGEWREADA
ncbi:glycerophosphodiester phosphodiesterase [Pararhodobacter sp. CCB-MM2]|uniref:glycerophosphodiester phosphodiesterase n=1 Tax=Pararhodobacter sp. CCB-MM2 TaxID=1786003 RepID=UPI00082E16B5|nr:glycerophosphodiester phosphodiesterase [Pararhodobacter sp. CCB-MM2]